MGSAHPFWLVAMLLAILMTIVLWLSHGIEKSCQEHGGHMLYGTGSASGICVDDHGNKIH